MADKQNAQSITLIIDSRLDNVPLVGTTVRAICEYLSIEKIDTYHLELCAVEAVNNVIKHAYASNPGYSVEMSIALIGGMISFRISDMGKQMDLKKHHTLDFEPENTQALPEGGMGLFLIHSLMDEVAYEKVGEKNILTLNKYLKASSSS